jgi:PII-like signaling protein
MTAAPESSTATRGVSLVLYMNVSDRHARMSLYKWLLRHAQEVGMSGGSARQTICGYGRRGRWHDIRVVDLSIHTAMRVEFLTTDADARRLLAMLAEERLEVIYCMTTTAFGVTAC